jgi:5-methylthioadenosine/S-adenosylhomocysteine deaminase
MLYEVPSTPDAAVSARTAYVRTQLGAAEMLKLGSSSTDHPSYSALLAVTKPLDAMSFIARPIRSRRAAVTGSRGYRIRRGAVLLHGR